MHHMTKERATIDSLQPGERTLGASLLARTGRTVVASISTARRLSSVLCGTHASTASRRCSRIWRWWASRVCTTICFSTGNKPAAAGSGLSNRAMRATARRFLDDIGVDIPSVDTPVAKLSGRRTSRSCCSTSPAAMGAKETSLIIELIKSLSKPVLLPSVANTPRQIGFEISGARITCAALRSSRSAMMRNDRLRKFAPLSGLELIAGNRPCLSRNQSTDEW
jgi:hypothetical protein